MRIATGLGFGVQIGPILDTIKVVWFIHIHKESMHGDSLRTT